MVHGHLSTSGAMECDKAKVISHFSDERSLGFGEWLLVDIESDSYVYYNERNEGGLLEATPEVAEYVCTAAACTTTAAGTTATSVTAATMAVTAAVPGTCWGGAS